MRVGVYVLLLALLAAAPASADLGGGTAPAVPLVDGVDGPSIPTHVGLGGDPSTGRVLAVWPRPTGFSGSEMVARPLKRDGHPAGPLQVLATEGGPEGAQFALDDARGQALVVWIAVRTGGSWELVTRLIANDGTPRGPARIIPVDTQGLWLSDISVAFNPKAQEYLLAYGVGPQAGPKAVRRIDVQRVGADGKAIAPPETRLERRTGRMTARLIATRNGRDMLIYTASSVARAKPLDERGEPLAVGDILLSAPGSVPSYVPRVAHDPVSDRFLVTWREGRTDRSDHFMLRTLDANGTPDAAPRTGPPATSSILEPAPDADGSGWLVSWVADRYRQTVHLAAMRVAPKGTPVGEPFDVASGGVADPALIGLDQPGRFMAAWSVAPGLGAPYAPWARRLAAGDEG